MGFYGNITNTSRTQFTFDKTYANRVEMDAHANTDGIYVGRYVLVEYDNYMSADWCTDVYLKEGVFYTSPNMELNSKVLYGVGNIVKNKYLRVPAVYIDPETKKEVIHNFDATAENKYKDVLYRIQETEVGEVPNVELILITDEKNKYVENYQIDMKQYGEGRGYDSTVWQKVYTDNHERYVMIAELNTVVPTFGVSADAPTLSPITPHFDADSSNVYYKVHWQPAWGLRIKSAAKTITSPLIDDDGKSIGGTVQLSNPMTHSLLSDENTAWYRTVYNPSTGAFKDLYYSAAVNPDTLETSGNWDKRAGVNNTETVPAAIYYNKAGFNPEYITYSDSDLPVGMNPIVDKIALEPTGKSGYAYNKHDGTAGKEAQIDTQELSILLPSIGDTMAKIWDLVYGNEKLTGSRNRNLNIKWSNGSITPDLSGLRLVTKSNKGYGYEPGQVSTIAGAINSVHDLMGMIIREYDGSTLDENYIYYKPDEGVYGRRAKKYTYKPFALTNNTFDKESRFTEVELAGTISGFYADYASSNPLNPNTSKVYPNYIYDSALSNNGKQSYKTIKVNEEEKIRGAELADGVFEPYKFFVYKKEREVTVGNGSQTTTITTESYQVSLDTSFQANTSYLKVEYTDLPSNTRFYQPGLYYRPEFEGPTIDHTYKNYESGELFELDDNGRYVRPTSYVVGKGYYMMKTPIVPYTGTVLDSEQYFEVSSYVEDGDNVLVERSYYEEDRNVNADNFLSRPRYVTEDKVVYTLASQFIAGTTYYNKITTWEEQTDTISPSALQEVKLIVYNEGRTVYHRIPKGGGGANGLEEFIRINNNLIGYYKDNLVHIAFTPISSVYGPNLYYYLEDSGTLKGSWIFDSNSTPTLDRDYYLPSALTAESPVEIGDKYEPFKFYHKVNNDFILDANSEPTENRTYYTKKGLYVLEDTTGLYPKGTEWSISVETVPTNITLAEKEESWGFEELPGFARNMNTIHGLILKLNNLLESGDADVRNYNTAQGLINKLRDIILQFGELRPNQVMATDSYGRVLTKTVNGDNKWINVENNATGINISHKPSLESDTNSTTVSLELLADNITPGFGESIALLTNKITQDASGHLLKNSVKSEKSAYTITMPTLSLTRAKSGNVVTGITGEFSNDNRTYSLTENRNFVGDLPLVGYSVTTLDGNNNPIIDYLQINGNTTTINQAFDKVNTVFDKVYDILADLPNTITSNALLKGYQNEAKRLTKKDIVGIKDTDTINQGFAKVNKYFDTIKLDRYQEVLDNLNFTNEVGATQSVDERLQNLYEQTVPEINKKMSLSTKELELPVYGVKWSSLIYFNYTFIGIGEGHVITSRNGIDWDHNYYSDLEGCNSLVGGADGNIIAYNNQGIQVCVSKDNGASWYRGLAPLVEGDFIDQVCYGATYWLFIFRTPGVGRRFYSTTDAVTWTSLYTEANTSPTVITSLTYGDKGFIYTAASGAIRYSATGKEWPEVWAKEYYEDGITSIPYIARYGLGKYFAIGGNSLLISSDPSKTANWTKHDKIFTSVVDSPDYFGIGDNTITIVKGDKGYIVHLILEGDTVLPMVTTRIVVNEMSKLMYPASAYGYHKYITLPPSLGYTYLMGESVFTLSKNYKIIEQDSKDITTNVLEFTNINYQMDLEESTGNKWIDGKPIYRQVVWFGDIPASTKASTATKGVLQVDLGVSVDSVISMKGFAQKASSPGTIVSIPYSHVKDSYNLCLGVNNAKTEGTSSQAYLIYPAKTAAAGDFPAHTGAYVIIEYTKL